MNNRFLAPVFLLLFAVLGASAQDLANIVGTVTDPSGAVVAGAKITVTNAERGFTRVAESNAGGEYSVARVPIGNYTIVAQAPGFERLLRTGITLDAGQTLRIPLDLHVGSTTQQMVVTADTVHVETETGAVSHVVNSTQVSELNLESRNFATLATLIPGAAPAATGFDPSSTGVLAMPPFRLTVFRG